MSELLDQGEVAGPALRKALAGNPSLEARKRLEALMDRLESAPLAPETVRQIRAVEALEFIGNTDARGLLARIAAGPHDTRLRHEARAACLRLGNRTGVVQ